MEVAEAKEIEWTPERGREQAYVAADKYKINREVFVKTMECESSFSDPSIQSGHYKNGVRETSFGYAQFNLPSGLQTADGRTITKEIAIDPVQSLDAAAYLFSVGQASAWSCYKNNSI